MFSLAHNDASTDLFTLQVNEMLKEIQPVAPNSLAGFSHLALDIQSLPRISLPKNPVTDLLVTLPKGWVTLSNVRKHAYLTRRQDYVDLVRQKLEGKGKVEVVPFAGEDLKSFLKLKTGSSVFHLHFAFNDPDVTAACMEFLQSEHRRKAQPRYTLMVLEDILVARHADWLKPLSVHNGADATLLLKLWAQQHAAHFFSGFLVAMLMVALCHNNIVQLQAHPLQVFRQVMAFLANTDLTTHSLGFQKVPPCTLR
eukprot:NODE_4349_length_802_cov_30.423704_g4191_i0.p1 GENE.NODE_4349_length_802_cov_30.423704_g4191_i0~~NODE_4349_length_802_cov_30.423704_g4191_i0.p1  ORF type:complete len:266 (+),score=80.04 NODE_4349_length_802_cov_30.423704_g4191_i0:39-800(+)